MAEPTADQVSGQDSVAGEESMDTDDNAPEGELYKSSLPVCLNIFDLPGDGTVVENTPQYGVQKTEIHTALQQRLKKGETW